MVTNQEAEDLKQGLGMSDIDDLDDGEQMGILFQDLTNVVSPGRRMTTLYSMENGKEVPCMQYRRREWLRKRDVNGNRRFTANKAEAPEYVRGQEKCFLHAESEARLSGELQAAGLGSRPACRAGQLQSIWAADQHGEKKHRQEWKAYQAYLEKVERDELRADQRRQTEAMLALAGRSMPAPTEPLPFHEEALEPSHEVMDYDDFVQQDAEEAFASDWHKDMNAKQLRDYAERIGVEFHPPSKYVSRDELIKMIEGK